MNLPLPHDSSLEWSRSSEFSLYYFFHPFGHLLYCCQEKLVKDPQIWLLSPMGGSKQQLIWNSILSSVWLLGWFPALLAADFSSVVCFADMAGHRELEAHFSEDLSGMAVSWGRGCAHSGVTSIPATLLLLKLLRASVLHLLMGECWGHIVEEHMGWEILLWSFLENVICHRVLMESSPLCT